MRCPWAVLGITLALTQNTVAAKAPDTFRVIIKYKQTIGSPSSLKTELAHSIHASVQKLTPMANGAYAVTLQLPAGLVKQKEQDIAATLLTSLRNNPNVLYAVKDRIGYFKPVPAPKIDQQLSNLLSHQSQWDEFSRPGGVMLESEAGLRDGAWAYTTGRAQPPIVVAVLDTGIALNDSLTNNLVKGRNGKVWGWNFAANNNNLTDETKSYHGTHVAGTIAGYGGVMTGMGEDLKILPVKIPDGSGMFYESAVINGIYWSVGASVPGVPNNPYPAKVLNMSFGVDLEPGQEIDYCDDALQEAVSYARNKGAVLAVAAGNDNHWEHFNAPAVCEGTLKIASTGPKGLRSYFSNYGPSVSFAAPGGDLRYGLIGGILSTVNPGGGYEHSGFNFYQGTSMATPHVAGIAGLIFAASNSPLTAAQVEQILYVSTHDFGESTQSNNSCIGEKPCGHGILDAENAVKTVLAGYDVLLSAPRVDDLAVKSCPNSDLVQPEGNKVLVGEAIWVKQESECQSNLSYVHPHVEQAQEGAIYAYYGSVSYQLDQSNFKECRVVGYDGVGCYR